MKWVWKLMSSANNLVPTSVLGEQPSLPSGSYFSAKDPFNKGWSLDLGDLSSSLALSTPEFCYTLITEYNTQRYSSFILSLRAVVMKGESLVTRKYTGILRRSWCTVRWEGWIKLDLMKVLRSTYMYMAAFRNNKYYVNRYNRIRYRCSGKERNWV